MNTQRTVSPLIPIVALVFAACHIAFEYFNGGVKTHHFLARGDLPGFTNWLGLAVLPLVAIALAVRVGKMQKAAGPFDLPRAVAIPLMGSLLYGATLAASFHFGATQVSLVVLGGLLLAALALPVYRAEYMLGFIVGMTTTFGSVISLLFAIVFGALSFGVRRLGRLAIAIFRSRRA